MSNTKNKPGIHLYKTQEAVINRRTGRWNGYKTVFYWHIVARNGRIIARSSETYSRKSGAVNGIKIAKEIFKKYWCGYYDHSKKDSPIKSYL